MKTDESSGGGQRTGKEFSASDSFAGLLVFCVSNLNTVFILILTRLTPNLNTPSTSLVPETPSFDMKDEERTRVR